MLYPPQTDALYQGIYYNIHILSFYMLNYQWRHPVAYKAWIGPLRGIIFPWHLSHTTIWAINMLGYWYYRQQFDHKGTIVIATHWWVLAKNCENIADSFSVIVSWLPYNHMDGLVQERLNSSALAIELCLSYANPSICTWPVTAVWLAMLSRY